ncbi:MAG: 50S ribosomal protein L6 [Phycisphaeraceae bacterium]|nr:50S ribosomal protein L6 [Phycisphaeraceae bacterium]MCW5754339.1 50S ribosomal protein L6 [Phycisphaeraceae bacterium]
MSRIGKKAVAVPSGVKVAIQNRQVKVEGPKGALTHTHPPHVEVRLDDSGKLITCAVDLARTDDSQVRADWGTTRAVIQNMVDGVSKGFERKLEVVGVGWSAAVTGKQIKLVLGFANPVILDIPQGVNVAVEKQLITITGPDKQRVGQFAAELRSRRKPEPYNGKGIKYAEETIRRKQGKQFGS